MEIKDNVMVDRALDGRISSGALTLSDYTKLTVANFVAGFFPEAEVYTSPQQQGVHPPAIFIDFYEIANGQRTINTSVYEFGTDVSYLPEDALSSGERDSFLFRVMQEFYRIGDEFPVVCYERNAHVTDGMGHVTGIIRVHEIDLPDDPIIRKAEQDTKLKE